MDNSSVPTMAAAGAEVNRLPVPCFGVGCERHQDCYHYLLIEGSRPNEVRMSMCGKVRDRPLFQPIPEGRRTQGDRRGAESLPNGRRTT